MNALTDAEIQRAVLYELSRDGRVEPTEVGVEVDNSIVTLTGTVSSWAKKLAAEEVTHRVVGVLDVANDLAVQTRRDHRPSDTEVAAAIRQALIRDVLVPEEAIQTTVRDGIVTLEGVVDHASERDEAIWKVRGIAGVCGVQDRITVRRRGAPAVMQPATRQDIDNILGELDGSVVARIEQTDATASEIAEALADLESEREAGVRREPSTARVAAVRAILEELGEDDDEDYA